MQANTGCLKKRNLFELEYLKYDSVKLIVLLGAYSVLPYNSIKPVDIHGHTDRVMTFRIWTFKIVRF